MNLTLQKLFRFSKKNDPNDKTTYRPISLLPLKQIKECAGKILSPKLCGFRKAYWT